VIRTTGEAARPSGWWWVLLASAAGFAASAVFTTALHLERRLFVAAWLVVALAVWAAYHRSTRLSVREQLSRHWRAGLVVGATIGAVLTVTIVRQPASESPVGAQLVADVVWVGVAYGLTDALILSVLPVLALYGSQPAERLRTPASRLRLAAAALAGSAVIAAAYHLGFAEYRGPQLIQPVFGNLLITLGYLLSGSPVAPAVAHVIMHLAALLHGAAGAVQLPPHY
jgi:hypothetical protein